MKSNVKLSMYEILNLIWNVWRTLSNLRFKIIFDIAFWYMEKLDLLKMHPHFGRCTKYILLPKKRDSYYISFTFFPKMFLAQSLYKFIEFTKLLTKWYLLNSHVTPKMLLPCKKRLSCSLHQEGRCGLTNFKCIVDFHVKVWNLT